MSIIHTDRKPIGWTSPDGYMLVNRSETPTGFTHDVNADTEECVQAACLSYRSKVEALRADMGEDGHKVANAVRGKSARALFSQLFRLAVMAVPVEQVMEGEGLETVPVFSMVETKPGDPDSKVPMMNVRAKWDAAYPAIPWRLFIGVCRFLSVSNSRTPSFTAAKNWRRTHGVGYGLVGSKDGAPACDALVPLSLVPDALARFGMAVGKVAEHYTAGILLPPFSDRGAWADVDILADALVKRERVNPDVKLVRDVETALVKVAEGADKLNDDRWNRAVRRASVRTALLGGQDKESEAEALTVKRARVSARMSLGAFLDTDDMGADNIDGDTDKAEAGDNENNPETPDTENTEGLTDGETVDGETGEILRATA